MDQHNHEMKTLELLGRIEKLEAAMKNRVSWITVVCLVIGWVIGTILGRI